MRQPILTIARYTMLEAWRNRLPWLLLLAVPAAVGGGLFLRALALTDSLALPAALLAALLRLLAVFLLATFIISSMAREAQEQRQQQLLALPLPRAAYLLGKLTGFGALAVLPALLFGALALLVAPAAQAAWWAASLLCELWLMAAFSLLCVLGLGQVLPALAASAAFYLLARSIATLQLLGHADQQAGWAGSLLDLLALLLPHLDTFTRSEWLVYHDGSAAALAAIAAQTALYLLLLTAAALYDLYRKAL